MNKIIKLFLIVLFLLTCSSGFAKVIEGTSPDGTNKISIVAGENLTYSVKRKGQLVIAPSLISLSAGGQTWGKNSKLLSVENKIIDEAVTFTVPRKYKQLNSRYRKILLKFRGFDLEFRVYNDGIAYRFAGKSSGIAEINGEEANFNFGSDCRSYTLLTNKLQNWFEENYTQKNLNALPVDSFSIMPVLVKSGKLRVLLGEANVDNYSGMYLQPQTNGFKGIFANYPSKEEIIEGGNKLYATAREPYIVKCSLQRTFPWRVAGVFDDDISIVKSELIYLLSDGPDAGTDFSWIKPGKAIWDWWNDRNITGVNFRSGVNTLTYKYLIDFAAAHHIEYVLVDEGWSEANDVLKLNPEVDMNEICRYAEEKNVGIHLWLKWINIDRQMNEAFSLFDKWHVKGIKIDFMDRNDAKMVNFYHRVVAKAALHKLTVNFHGAYPPDGLRRKFPNLLTREGVIGLEYNKWSKKATPEHDLIIPFIRMWSGPMDYTPGAMLNAQGNAFFALQSEPMSQGTRAHQLAMYVIYESPLQMLSDSPVKYDANPSSLKFLEEVPVVWDDTKVFDGEIGGYLLMGRKKGDTWYVAAMAGEKSKDIKLDLSFLKHGSWEMEIYKDGPNASKNGKDVLVEKGKIQSGNSIDIHMEKGGGWVGVFKLK